MKTPFPVAVRFPAGRYFIGDPCYMFKYPTWDELSAKSEWFDNPLVEHNGLYMWATGTAYGDGGYFDQFENEYSVDAGLIGVIPLELFDREDVGDREEWLISCGRIHTFTEDFTVECNDGVFKIGIFEIDTAELDPYDEGEDY